MVVAIGINKNLEVVVVVDDGVALGEGGVDMGLDHAGGDVEKLVIPSHGAGGFVAWRGFEVAFDVGELVGPDHVFPDGIIQLAVDDGGFLGAFTDISAGCAHPGWNLKAVGRLVQDKKQQGHRCHVSDLHSGVTNR